MKLSNLILISLYLFCVACQTESTDESKRDARPNILFIMTDDHSYQTLSAYDTTYIRTPNLDRIAKDGILFHNSFVTNSICGPSRAVMITGKFSHKNGFPHNSSRFDGSQPTMPKYLREAGYKTALIGKWHLKSKPTGFDYSDVLIGQGNYYNPVFINNENDTVLNDGYVTNIITDKAINWLDGQSSDQPFCLLLHHKATHRIWKPDTSLLHTMEGIKFEVPETYFDNYENRLAAQSQKMSIIEDMDLVYDLKMLDAEGDLQTKYRKSYENMINRLNPEQRAVWDEYYNPIIEKFKAANLSGKELALWKYQRYMEDYLKCVRSVDDNVGRILDYLEEKGLADNTLIVYTSDQGFYMGEHGWFDKRFMYEESMRTPLLMKFPKNINTVKEVSEMVQNIDYAPTFLDLAGLPVPGDMQGESLLPLVQGKEENLRDALYYHYYEYPNEHMVKRHYGIRTDQYKLIHFYEDIDSWELYDLNSDPQEMKNLYGQADMADITEDLKAQLNELQIKYEDTDRSTY
ncbi:sulfatase family protein [Membranihabitans marinus]|uniref:sulfatase family protein n=1 Tax=Membranihabitans marinus TaxID=1227546 RepID=UPI001F222D06|nr:sulfatase [Membranihabitans marinus]